MPSLLSVLTLVFLLVVVTLQPCAYYAGTELPIPVLIALLVCLIPTTIGALISAIGIAGMDRLAQQNVLAMLEEQRMDVSSRLDRAARHKTGTLGNRQATEFVERRRNCASWTSWRTCPAAVMRSRELALRAIADEVGEKTASYRAREGLSRRSFLSA